MLKRLQSVEQYKQLKSEAQERCKSLATNCYLTNGGLESMLAQQDLFYDEYEQGFALFADDDSYYNVFYYLDPTCDVPTMQQDRLVVIEEPDSGGRRQEYLESFFGKLEAAGWRRIAHNLQVRASLAGREDEIADSYQTALCRIEEQGYRLVACPERHVDRVIELWKGYLHQTDLPGEHLAFFGDSSQQVICVLDESDYVCGVNWWKFRGGACEIRHSVTDPGHYQRGIGYAMQMAAMQDAVAHGCRSIFTYIDETNYRSLGMFKKAGLLPNGKTTTQYGLSAVV